MIKQSRLWYGAAAGDEETTGSDLSWSYVGRYMWGFGQIETVINIIFWELYGLSGPTSVMISANFDLRKKLDLITIGLKHQRIEQHKEILRRVHKLHDIRNVIAHSSFYDEPLQGVIFDSYFSRSGERRLPHKPKGEPDVGDDNRVITYAEFDAFDDEAAAIFNYLQNQIEGTLTPITHLDDSLESEITDVVAGASNVIPFPRSPRDPP
jgi:hypothetical protein